MSSMGMLVVCPPYPAPWVCSADKEQYGWAAGLDNVSTVI